MTPCLFPWRTKLFSVDQFIKNLLDELIHSFKSLPHNRGQEKGSI